MTYRLGSAALAVATCLCPSFAAGFTPTIRFSEFQLDSPGTDDGREYFEISGPAGASLDGLFILEIEGDGGASGVIDGVFDLTGLSLGSNGLLLLRDQDMVPVGDVVVPGVLNPAPAPETTVYYENNIRPGDFNNDGTVNTADYTVWRDALETSGAVQNDLSPSSVGSDDYDTWTDNYGLTRAFFNRAGDVENESITMAIVRNFTGSLDQDLDTNNDGALDATPWTEVVDAVGFNEGPIPNTTPGGAPQLNNTYATQLGGIDFEGTLSGLDAVPGIAATLDGYVLLSDGQGGFIATAYDPDESNTSQPEFFFDDGTGNLQLIDTSALGPWSLDQAPGFPEMVTVDENGDLFFVTPETTLVTGELLGFPGIQVVGSDGLPIARYLVSPGNVNATGVIGISVADYLTPPGLGVPEPATVVVSLLAAVMSFAGSRRR